MQNKKINSTFKIQNLKCHSCAHTITIKLSDLEGIKDVEVNHTASTVSFLYDNGTALTLAKILLYNLGYPMVGDKNAQLTKVKSFVSCAFVRINN
jgi:copper chaperone